MLRQSVPEKVVKPIVDVGAALRYAESMIVEATGIPDVVLIEPDRHDDERGWLSEVWNPVALDEAGISATFVQDNLSLSYVPGVVRALHFQVPPYEQGKLIACLTGAIFDVALDLRNGSPTYGAHVSAELNAETGQLMWIPPGFAHGYCSLEPDTRVLYKLTAPYRHEASGGILWNDSDLEIEWPEFSTPMIVNERDRNWQKLSEFNSPFQWTG